LVLKRARRGKENQIWEKPLKEELLRGLQAPSGAVRADFEVFLHYGSTQ
jgi:hypothetical protein